MRVLGVRPAGARGLLAEVADSSEALDLATWARTASADAGLHVEEVVPAAVTVLFDGVSDMGGLRSLIATWAPSATAATGELVEVPVVYDGPDLEDVGRRWGCSAEDVAARHASYDFVSAFCGFAPGFAYLAGLPPELALPRLHTPRPRVPAGSVGLADSWCGVYPTASPGGWRLLGRTTVALWDAGRDRPALLAPGTRVRFVVA